MCAAEKQVLRDQAKAAGSGGKPKPANIIEKIISGRINKVTLSHTLSTAVTNGMLAILHVTVALVQDRSMSTSYVLSPVHGVDSRGHGICHWDLVI